MSFFTNYIKLRLLVLFYIGTIFFFNSGCNPTQHLQPNQIFLKNVKIKTDNRKLDLDELHNIIKQHPNKKILGVLRFHLGVYNFFYKKEKIRDDVGEAPVVYDSLLTKRSIKQINLYLKNKGYYENKVTASAERKKNEISIKYNIASGPPYIVKWVNYAVADKALTEKVVLKNYKSLIKKNKPLDIDKLDAERDRIRDVLKNEGYYYFTKDYVKFKIDSTIGNKDINITTVVLNKQPTEQDTSDLKHHRFYLNYVNLYLSKDFTNKNINGFDSTSYKGLTIYFDTKKLSFRPRMLKHSIMLNPKDLYLLKNQQNTYKHLSELKLFKTISVQFKDIGKHQLNTNIYVTLQKSQSLAFEAIGTNSGGNLGLEGNFIYLHKNLFNGGERLTAKFKGGIEVQQLINATETTKNRIQFFGLPFNTFEFGPEISLEFPRFLLPISLEKFSNNVNPKTTLKYLLNLQERPEYIRNLTTLSFGYFWNAGKYRKHSFNPINVSIIKLKLTPDFRDKILLENNPFIVNSFTDHFINSSTYTFTYSNQSINRVRDFIFFRFNTEVAGNTLTLYNKLTNAKKNANNGFEMLGIQYSQFVKIDLDYRYYKKSSLTTLVSRISLGVGKPYGNLNVLPFEESYYGGGANGIRAWQARTLGPGSMPDSLISGAYINQIGELKIEGNLEYRFNLTKIFKGAIFTDAGNIWILKPDPQRPNGEIKLDKFWRDIAVGVGVGLRLDFNFFLIRFDLAAKLKDPATFQPEKFQLQWKTPTLNLGIGYPF